MPANHQGWDADDGRVCCRRVTTIKPIAKQKNHVIT